MQTKINGITLRWIIVHLLFALISTSLLYNLSGVAALIGFEIQPFGFVPELRFFVYFAYSFYVFSLVNRRPIHLLIICLPFILIDATALAGDAQTVPIRFPFQTIYPVLGVLSAYLIFKSIKMATIMVVSCIFFFVIAKMYITPSLLWYMHKEKQIGNSYRFNLMKDIFKTIDNKNITLADTVKSRLIMAEFYFEGCAPCIEKLRSLVRISKEFNKSDLEIILICDGSITSYKIFCEAARRIGNTGFTLLYDDTGLCRKYSIKGYPTEFLVYNNRIVGTDLGFGSEIRSSWEKNEIHKIKKILSHEN